MSYDFKNERKITLVKPGGLLFPLRYEKYARHDGETVSIVDGLDTVELSLKELDKIYWDMVHLGSWHPEDKSNGESS